VSTAANIEEQRTWLNTMQTFVADGNLSDPPSPKSANKIELINNDKLDIEEKVSPIPQCLPVTIHLLLKWLAYAHLCCYQYAFGKMLGSGVAGEVHLATHRQTGVYTKPILAVRLLVRVNAHEFVRPEGRHKDTIQTEIHR
jgi:hypothetical protein